MNNNSKPPRRKWRKWIIVPLVLLVVLLVIVVVSRNALTRGLLVKQLEQSLDAEVLLDGYSLSPLFNELWLGDFALRNSEQREIVRLDSLRTHFSPMAALGGELDVVIDLDGLVLNLWREKDGSWNVENLPRDAEEQSGSDEAKSEQQEPSDSSALESRIRLNLTNTHIFVFADGGKHDEPLEEWTVELSLDARVSTDEEGATLVELALLEFELPMADGNLRGDLQILGEFSSSPVRFEKLRGKLSCDPNALSEAFDVQLPAKFGEDVRESVEFNLSGTVPSTEFPALLSDLEGSVQLALEQFSIQGVELNGSLLAELEPGGIGFEGDFDANGGKLEFDGELMPEKADASAQDPAAKLSLTADRVRLDGEASELFAYLHPAFALVDDATVEGTADARIELSWGAPIPWQVLLADEGDVALDALSGHGSIKVDPVSIEGSSLLQKLREQLDGDPAGALRLRKMSFALQNGRLSYQNPWTWTIGETETSFAGSVGLDQSLDLTWRVPVSATLAQKFRFLKKLEGTLLEIPVRGTSGHPEIEFGGLVENVAESLLDDVLPGLLPELLGGGDGESKGPEELLRSADKLWDDEDFVAAAEIYARIRSEFKVSLVYALNRKRIKKRSRYEK